MNPKTITTSLALSKKLKELGFPQESLFYHGKVNGGLIYEPMFPNQYVICSAPTPTEILAVLPAYSTVTSSGTGYHADNIEILKVSSVKASTPANALAKMLIYLAENQLIDLGEGKA